MGFLDEFYEEDQRPRRRRTRRGIGDSDRLDWQDMVDEVEDPDAELEPDEELEEENEDTIQELEIDEHGRMRHNSRDEIDPSFWDQDE